MPAPRFPTSLTGDGATKVFNLGFPIIDQKHVRVIVAGALKVLGTDYTVQDPTAKNPTIRFFNAPANAAAIQFYRNTPLTVEDVNLVVGPRESLYAQYRAEELSDRLIAVPFFINATDLAARTTQNVVAPCDGYVTSGDATISEVIGATGGTLQVAIDGVDVTGMTNVIANAAPAAKRQLFNAPSVAQASYTKVRRGQMIQVKCPTFAGGGAIHGNISILPADF